MIILARGLVLRHGERLLEFERSLGDDRVQFKYQDNFEVVTLSASQLFKNIYGGKFHACVVPPASSEGEAVQEPLPVSWTPGQLALIDFRMRYVEAVLAAPARIHSRELCSGIATEVHEKLLSECRNEKKAPPRFEFPAGSTVWTWVRRYLSSGRNAFVLCDRRAFVRRPKRVCALVEQIVVEFLSKRYLSLRGPSVKAVHSEIRRHIEQLNKANGTTLQWPAERTINRRVLEIPPYIREVKRLGSGKGKHSWRYSMAGDQSTRIMERVEIDHTLLDIWVIDPRTGVPLGRPWITLLIDRYSGYLIGLYISFYGPSSATVARALQVAILPKEDWLDMLGKFSIRWTAMGVPELLVMDNGLEFHGLQMRRIGWELRCDLIFNPVRQPWHKAAIERSIMESNRTLPMHGRVHAVIDNAVAPNPAKTAAIVFDDLCLCLVEWASQFHPLQVHPKTLCRPWDLWEEGRMSRPPAMMPPQLTGLDMLCGLSTTRRIDGDGVFFNYLRFNSVELQDYRRSGGGTYRADIRFNPDDLSRIYVNLPKAKSWLSVPLQRPLFDDGWGVSLVQLQIIREEAGKRLNRANAYEEMENAANRLQQRWEDAARRGLRIRKDSRLIRMQGMTSVPMEVAAPAAVVTTEAPLQESLVMREKLPMVMPFRSFSLDED